MYALLFALLLIWQQVATAQPQLLPGFPVQWLADGEQASVKDLGPLVYDLDQDGTKEIVVTGRTHITIYSHTGNVEFLRRHVSSHDPIPLTKLRFTSFLRSPPIPAPTVSFPKHKSFPLPRQESYKVQTLLLPK